MARRIASCLRQASVSTTITLSEVAALHISPEPTLFGTSQVVWTQCCDQVSFPQHYLSTTGGYTYAYHSGKISQETLPASIVTLGVSPASSDLSCESIFLLRNQVFIGREQTRLTSGRLSEPILLERFPRGACAAVTTPVQSR